MDGIEPCSHWGLAKFQNYNFDEAKIWMRFLFLWNQWPSWIRRGINGSGWIHLAWKYSFGLYVCICGKGVPAAVKASLACCNWFCFSSFWCLDMAQESGKGINEFSELGSASMSIVNRLPVVGVSNQKVDGMHWCNSKGQLGWTAPFPRGKSSSGLPVLGKRGQ